MNRPSRSAPGLGVDLDEARVAAMHELYQRARPGEHNDAAAMQHSIPGRQFDSKRPAPSR